MPPPAVTQRTKSLRGPQMRGFLTHFRSQHVQLEKCLELTSSITKEAYRRWFDERRQAWSRAARGAPDR